MSTSIADTAATGVSLGLNKNVKQKKIRAFSGFGLSMLGVLAFALYFYANFTTVVVSGESMQPTFFTGNRLLVSKAYWLVGPLKDKDIVVIQTGDSYIIKRVYRMGGEKVDLFNVPTNWSLKQGEYTVPEGMIYVLGDNRAMSEDSRVFGPVELSKVVGKVVIRPLKDGH
jgi:signal peptidase I